MLATLGSAGAVALAGIAPSIASGTGWRCGSRRRGGRWLWRCNRRPLPQALLQPVARCHPVELAARFFTCPFSNLVLGGLQFMDQISHGYDGLRAIGIKVVPEAAADVDATGRTVTLSGRWQAALISWCCRPVSTCAGVRSPAMTKPHPCWGPARLEGRTSNRLAQESASSDARWRTGDHVCAGQPLSLPARPL